MRLVLTVLCSRIEDTYVCGTMTRGNAVDNGYTQPTCCAAGEHKSEDGDSCTACEAGRYFPGRSAAPDCISCAAGKYVDVTGSDEAGDCIDCAAGTYAAPGDSECVECEAGTTDDDSDPSTPCRDHQGRINGRTCTLDDVDCIHAREQTCSWPEWNGENSEGVVCELVPGEGCGADCMQCDQSNGCYENWEPTCDFDGTMSDDCRTCSA